jgi:hypothetical protein
MMMCIDPASEECGTKDKANESLVGQVFRHRFGPRTDMQLVGPGCLISSCFLVSASRRLRMYGAKMFTEKKTYYSSERRSAAVTPCRSSLTCCH